MNPQQQKVNAIVAWVVILVVGTVIGIGAAVRSAIRANTVAPFQTELNTYLSGQTSGFNPNRAGVSRGKLIVVDSGRREVDDVYFDLPDEMRAGKPEDVGTVALLNWGEESWKGQSYTDGTLAMVQTCVVRVYRREGMVQVGERRLVGGPPPQMRKRSQSGCGPKPTTEVIDFLKTVYVQGMLKENGLRSNDEKPAARPAVSERGSGRARAAAGGK